MIITIDGPAGSGKSTAARELAKAMGIAYLDTGATYRAVTLKALRAGVNLQDEAALLQVAAHTDLQLLPGAECTRVFMDGEDVTRPVRSAEVTDHAHYAARSQVVREVLVAVQRRLGAELGSFVSEGRDQGSVVFPGADFKFYLDASPEVRARRRFEEMSADGQLVTYEEILRAINERDGRDRSRAVAPLVVPPGATQIDTSGMNVSQMTAALLRRVEARR
jgi:cytidylate kinase